MIKKTLLYFTVLLLTSCSFNHNERLTISTTTWIGYTPLFYAKEKGWLEPLNIKLLSVASLSENMYLYKAGNSDAYVGTQYEYELLKPKKPSLMPIMMFDRSNGGDMVMSNVSINELQNTKESIDAYLEMDSINYTILKDFVSKYTLQDKTINYINEDQKYISTLKVKDMRRPTIIVTYTPYNPELEKHGLKRIASTKESLDLCVVDAMFATQETFKRHKEQFVELKKLVDRAIVDLVKNPDEFYETIKPYILDISKEEFKKSLHDIEWINKELSEDIKERMLIASFPIRNII